MLAVPALAQAQGAPQQVPTGQGQASGNGENAPGPSGASTDASHTETSVTQSAATARKAQQHFEQGLHQFEAHHFREAIEEFELAANLVPSADLWFNIARAHEELNEYDEAIQYYQRYLRDRVDPPDSAAGAAAHRGPQAAGRGPAPSPAASPDDRDASRPCEHRRCGHRSGPPAGGPIAS